MSLRSRSLSDRRSRDGGGTPGDRIVLPIVALIALFLIFLRVHSPDASLEQRSSVLWWMAAVVAVGVIIELADHSAPSRAKASTGFWLGRRELNDLPLSSLRESPLRALFRTDVVAFLLVDAVFSSALWKWSQLSPVLVVVAVSVSLGILTATLRLRPSASRLTERVVHSIRGPRALVPLAMALTLLVELVRLHVASRSGRVVSSDLAVVAGVVGSGVVVGVVMVGCAFLKRVKAQRSDDMSHRDDSGVEGSLGPRLLRGLRTSPGVTVALLLTFRSGIAGIGTVMVIEVVALLSALFAVQSGSVLGFLGVAVVLGILGDRVSCLVVSRLSAGTVLLGLRQGAMKLQRSVTQTLAVVTAVTGAFVTVALGLVLGSSSLVIELGVLFVVPATLSVVVGFACVRLVELEDSVVGSKRGPVVEMLHRSTLPLYVFAALIPLVQIRSALESGSDLLSPAISAAFFLLLFPLAGSAWISRRTVRRG